MVVVCVVADMDAVTVGSFEKAFYFSLERTSPR